MNPLCVLDFYVYDKCQRSGNGKIIYTEMLNNENVEPRKLAIDRPSSKFLSFMKKYYNLANFVPQNNNYVLFKDYFNDNNKKISSVNKYYPYDHNKIAMNNKIYAENLYNNNNNFNNNNFNNNNNNFNNYNYNKQIENQLNNNNNIDNNIATYENNYKIFQNYSKLANRPLSHNNEIHNINNNNNNYNVPLQQQINNNNIYNSPYSKTNYQNLENFITDEPYEFIDTYKNSYEQKPYYHDFYKEQYKENYYNTQKYKQRDYFKYSAPSNNKFLYQPSSSAYGAYYNMKK